MEYTYFMNKNLQIFLIGLILLLNGDALATDENVAGYYQTINIENDTPCSCDEKTQRTFDLAKGIRPGDVSNYDLHAYKIVAGDKLTSIAKIFKAFEKDNSVYKLSIIEWNSILLLTNKDFDKISFETAAKNVFSSFESITPEIFLKQKNIDAYKEYVEFMADKLDQPSSPK